MAFVEIVAVLAIFQFLGFGLLTGMAREKTGVKAPAVSGHQDFERMYRVQMNTLEMLVAFLPVMFLAAKYWSPTVVALLGVVYLVGRTVYWKSYVKEPSKRTIGFMLSFFSTVALAIMALVGIVLSLM